MNILKGQQVTAIIEFCFTNHKQSWSSIVEVLFNWSIKSVFNCWRESFHWRIKSVFNCWRESFHWRIKSVFNCLRVSFKGRLALKPPKFEHICSCHNITGLEEAGHRYCVGAHAISVTRPLLTQECFHVIKKKKSYITANRFSNTQNQFWGLFNQDALELCLWQIR